MKNAQTYLSSVWPRARPGYARAAATLSGHSLPLLFYTTVGLLLTWPLLPNFTSAYPATPGEGAQDLWQNLWNLWWAGESLRRGANPFFADVLFYPQGASLLFHPLNLTGGWLALPLGWLGGPVFAYNMLVLLSFVLSGYAVFLLARHYECGRAAALLGGLAYSASAFHFAHLRLGHLEQVSMQWLALYALALDTLLRRRPTTDDRRPTNDKQTSRQADKQTETTQHPNDERRPTNDDRRPGAIGRAWPIVNSLSSILYPPSSILHPPSAARWWMVTLYFAAALLLVIFTSLYMALYAALLTGLWALWLVGGTVRRRAVGSAFAPLLHLSAALLLVLAIVGPALLVPMAREAQQGSYMQRSLDDAARGSAFAADALLPPPSHPLRMLLRLPAPSSLGAFLGYLPLGLALSGLAMRPRRGAPWLALALLAWLLSLGPQTPLYRLLYDLPPVQVARYPDRFAILALLGVAVAAAIGADALWGRLRGRARGLVAALVLGLLLIELRPPPVPLTAPIDDPFYHQLAREPQRFSVFELPINRFNNVWVDMAAQTLHRKPILYGALARDVPRIPFEWLPLIRELEHPDRPADIVLQPAEARAAALRFFNLRYILYHRSDENGAIVPPQASALSRAAGVPIGQVYADDELVAYRLELPDGPAALPPFASLGEGWYDLESPNDRAHRWLRGAAGVLQVYAPAEASVRLRLRLQAYRQARGLALFLDGQPAGRIDAQPWIDDVRTAPLRLTAGAHTLRLVPQEPGTAPRSVGEGDDSRALSVAVFEVEIEAGD